MGYFFDSTVLDIENLDLLMGKILDQGPVLVISFQVRLIMFESNRFLLREEVRTLNKWARFYVSSLNKSYV